jgi:transposase
MAYIKSYKNQNYLMPPNIKDLFSKNHICYLIEQMCDELDYSGFDDQYAGAGHPAYHPSIPLKLLLMAGVDGIYSSRRIAKNVQENIVYIYLAEKTQPDFRTISDFRKENQKLIKSVSKQLKLFALEKGLIDLNSLFVDGTIIQANANNARIISRETVEALENHIDKIIEKGIQVDEEEDKLFGDRGMHELPEELNDPKKRRPEVEKMVKLINQSIKEGKTESLREIKKKLNEVKQYMYENNINKYSFTDRDARFMLNKKGRIELSYNAQLVTEKNGFILSNEVVQNSDDRNQLLPNIDRTEKELGRLHKGTNVSADGIYLNGEGIQILDERGFNIHVPVYGMVKSVKNRFDKLNFQYDEIRDIYICPENKELTNRGKYIHSQKHVPMTIYANTKKICQACLCREACCKNQQKRIIHALPQDKLLNRIKERMLSKEGKEIYGLRKQTVERSFADIKHNKKFFGFLLRGINKVKTQFDLVCIAHNLVTLNNKLNKSRV